MSKKRLLAAAFCAAALAVAGVSSAFAGEVKVCRNWGANAGGG